MAFLEQRGDWYRIVFTFKGERYTHSVHTTDRRVADAIRGGIDRTILQLRQRLLVVPEDADVKEFLLSGGQTIKPIEAPAPATELAAEAPAPEPLTLARLEQKYVAALSVGAVELNSLDTIRMHLRHIERTFGGGFLMETLTLERLQEHVVRRVRAKGILKRPLSPITIRKEIASLRAAWNWAVQAKLLAGPFPNRGLKFPKTTEKPPFQTWAEIERQISQGGLDEVEQKELWDCLFLGRQETEDLLAFVGPSATQPWVYPMFCFAAHTGARRSEMLRARLADLDLAGGAVRIQEKKRSRGHRTSRRVPLSAFLSEVLRAWMAVHPGGPFLFAQNDHVLRPRFNQLVQAVRAGGRRSLGQKPLACIARVRRRHLP